MATGSSNGNGTVRLITLSITLGAALVGIVFFAAARPPRSEVNEMIENAPAIVTLKTEFRLFVTATKDAEARAKDRDEELLDAIKALKK